MEYRYKCDSCQSAIINGKPCHESGCNGSFVLTNRNRKFEQFRVWTLDVWGNKRDGFEVNDRSERGRVVLPIDSTDRQIIGTLKQRGYLRKGLHVNSFEIEWDENGYSIDWKNSSEPLLQLERQ